MKEKSGGAVPTSSMKTSKSPKLSPVTARTRKTVKFVASPVWKGRGSVGGGGVRRSVLKVLPANSRNSKLLVGQGSPRLPSFGKNAKTPLPHEVSAVDKENHLVVKRKTGPVLVTKAVQTVEAREREVCPSKSSPTASLTSAGSSLGEVVGMEEYWRELAERRRAALADTLMENEELHAEIVLLRCKVKELEAAARDAGYFAMMYRVSSCAADGPNSDGGTPETTVAAKH